MFKWMISGHKGHKHKQEKLNNAVLNNKNKNNLKHQPQQPSSQQEQQREGLEDQSSLSEQQQQLDTVLHISEPASNGVSPASSSQQGFGDVNTNLDKCDGSSGGTLGGAENDQLPPPPSSRPPPPPTHPPPPVPSHLQGLPQPPQQPLPPVPGHHEDNVYQQERPLQAPGTCTLPRRGLVREEPNGRYRSPSNPPPASRQPPPYSRHQPPDPMRRARGPYQPPPPPKIEGGGDARDHWDPRGSRDLCNPREPRERDFSRSRERHGGRGGHPDFTSARDRNIQDHHDERDNWNRRDFREHYDQREHRKSRNFQDILDTWEKRESNVHPEQPHDDQHRSSSLPRGNYDNWIAKTSRWSSRDPDSGFDSLNNPSAEIGPHSLDSVGGLIAHQSRCPIPASPEDVPYSQSTEDLLNASRTSPESISSTPVSSTSSSPVQYPTIRPAKQPCIGNALRHSPNSLNSPHSSPHPPSASPLALGSPHHHSTPVCPPRPPSPQDALLSDSVYPQHDGQPRYAEIPDVDESRGREEEPKNQRVSRDLRDPRDVLDERDGKANKNQRDIRNSHETRSTARAFRDTSLPRDARDYRDSRNSLEMREDRPSREREPRGFRERSVDGDDLDRPDDRCEVGRGRRTSRHYSAERAELSKEVRFSKDHSEGLRVRDVPSYEQRRDRDADGADDLQVTEQRRGSVSHSKDRGQMESRKGDGATASSVSWMEWTQQLQAYIAWVNSQLRKRGRPLITDLRRDLQDGVVFSDLIEIISGESVAGISREGNTVQNMRENLERILQFMAAKRIRMTHITSKEVVEGNLKSIMRIILALAAHYKPQSVKSSTSSNLHSQQQQDTANAPSRSSHPMPATHDIGVGPDAPVPSSEKTPNLSANRRAIMTGCPNDDSGGGGIVGLRRHPSMTAAQGPTRESSPVYENLPRRTAQNRWAYDSLRPSHKFQWTASQMHQRNGPPSIPPKSNMDESADDPLNSSFNASLTNSLNTSLNTSLEGDIELPSPRHDSGSRGTVRPGAMGFWPDASARRDSNTASPDQQSSALNQNSADDPDNPFRYHTIHRMSGRRKLPRIPGASCPSGSRISGRDESENSRALGDSPADRGGDDRSSICVGGGTNDEGSREPEGRSQNSSPATSLIRGPTLDQWPREKSNPLDPWEQESDLKGVLRDLNSTRDQLLALQHLLLATTTEVESRGVCTNREQLSVLNSSNPREKSSKDSSQKGHHNKENPARGKTLHCVGNQTSSPLRAGGIGVESQTLSVGHRNRHSRQELDPALRISIPGRTQELTTESTASAKQEIIHLSLARQALEAEKLELKRLLDQRENIITELRKQMHHRDKTIQAQRVQFEDAIRNLQNGKRTSSIGETALARGSPGIGGTREELQLVRDAIISLRGNFRGTDPNQHTLDTLEQAIAVLIERCGGLTGGGTSGVGAGSGGNGNQCPGGLTNGVISTTTEKSSRPGDKRLQVNGVVDSSTKVIYFTERTVTPFMSTISKRLGDIRLRDFKNMFDRPGLFRFHFKSHDPEYGMVKEEIVNDDDILPGVEGKIIAWVEEDTD